MEQLQIQCEALVNKCKQEAKQLAELAATRHKVHWTQSCFVSFCISVEDILSYGVRKRYTASRHLSSSAKILADLGKTFPVATATYNKCYGSKYGSASSPEDYAHLMTSASTERRILWLRVAIIESSLVTIVNEIIKNAWKYYTNVSVIYHPVYGEVFGYLLDGPCSIRVSRLKIADTALTSPTPAEIVKRHKKVLSASMCKIQQDGQSQTSTEEAWDHVKSLYQTSAATCLFGKNNIHVQPAGYPETMAGYLTLQRVIDNLQLKWIPNTLLKSASTESGSLWDHVLSIDIGSQVAHIHCHRSHDSAKLILIGYDGIAYPRLIFSHQPSLFQFLECLENNLLPRGCLEPPLWYIKTQTAKVKRSSWRPLSTPLPLPPSFEWGVGESEEWWEGVDVWNQVFRLRFSGRDTITRTNTESVIRGHLPHLSLNLHSLHGPLPALCSDSASSSSSSSCSSETPSSPRPTPSPTLNDEDHSNSSNRISSNGGGVGGGHLSPFGISIEKPTSLARKDWEKFQLKVSKQLLARYFYSWLSYCRHMKKVHHMVAHMVDASVSVQNLNPANYKEGIVKETWREFQANRNEVNWSCLLRAVYIKGVPDALRPEIWPWLLGLYSTSSSDMECESIRTEASETYNQELADWKKVEVIHLRQLAAAERERAERWRRECAANIHSHSGGFSLSVRKEGEGEEGGEERGIESHGESKEEKRANQNGAEDERVVDETEGGTERTILSSEDSSTNVTPQHDLTTLHNHHTSATITPKISPSQSAHASRSPSPEINTFSDLSISTTSSFPSPHTAQPSITDSTQDYIIPPQNDVITKTRSSSIDSGHSSNCNLGNSIDSSHGNSLVNGCHAEIHVGDVPIETSNGTEPILKGGEELALSTLTIVPDPAMETRDEGEEKGEGEGEGELDEKGQLFAEELIKIDKDIPRCDRDYWFFKDTSNLTKLRNIVSTYVWTHLEEGYSQGMCDLLAPLLVILQDEALTYACFLCLMKNAILLFPPHTGMNTQLSNLKALLQVLEPDFFQYLSERPLGDGLFYCYRWFLVSFKREFEYSAVFRLWETSWAARECCSTHFLEFCGLSIMTQYKPAIMDAHMDSSDILNLFTDLADSKVINCSNTITIAQTTIRELVSALTKRE